MTSLIKICNLNTAQDRKKITEVITNNEGIIACEISLKRKEVTVIYDELSIDIEEIMNSIELCGYTIL